MTVQLQPFLKMVLTERLQCSFAEIEAFCQRWKVVEFALFGSVLRDDFNSNSDIDILVTFAPDHGWNLFDLMDMQDELESYLQRPVDLLQKKELVNPYRRESILQTHQVIYAR